MKPNTPKNSAETDRPSDILAVSEGKKDESKSEQLLKELEDGLLDKSAQEEYLNYIKLIQELGNTEQKEMVAEIALRVAPNLIDQPIYGGIVTILQKDERPEIFLKGAEAMSATLEKYSVPEQVAIAWAKSGPQPAEQVGRNLSAIIELENSQPGVCSFLYKEFGIADFDRYPPVLLLKQFEEFDSLDKPYGIIIFPRADGNGAFYDNKWELEDLYIKLDGRMNLRVFECDGKMGVARALIKCRKKYKPSKDVGHKISLAIIGGHGDRSSIDFGKRGKPGKPSKLDTINIRDLMGEGARRTSEFFEDEATIILNSCSSGADGGIKEKLEEVMGVRVLAPDKPGLMDEIMVEVGDDGKLRFEVEYEFEKEDPETK